MTNATFVPRKTTKPHAFQAPLDPPPANAVCGWAGPWCCLDSYLADLREMLADADDEDKPQFQAMLDEATQ